MTLKISKKFILGAAWCKSGTRTPAPRTQDPHQNLKVGPGTPLKFKSGSQGPLQNLKAGPPDPLQSLKVGPS